MIFNEELHLKIKCYHFYYPDRFEKTFNLRRFTLVKNRHEKLVNDWQCTNDVFFSLKVDNKKFTDKYCATQHILKDHTCLEAAEFVAEKKSDSELHEHLSDHSRYVYTNTWDYSEYAGYMLDIKSIDDDATKNYLDFCDAYFREKDNVADEIQDNPFDNDGDLGGPQIMDCT